jgi:hypothetical protein
MGDDGSEAVSLPASKGLKENFKGFGGSQQYAQRGRVIEKVIGAI